jgi:hypothetical protein
MEEEFCIYIILSKLGSAYFVFVSTFYAMRQALGKNYKKPSLESFYDASIREQDNLVQLGAINTAGTSNKALVTQQKDKQKNPKKKHPCHNNKQHKGPKPTQTTSTPNGDKVLHIILVTLMMILQACVQALKRIFCMRKVTDFFLYKTCF